MSLKRRVINLISLLFLLSSTSKSLLIKILNFIDMLFDASFRKLILILLGADIHDCLEVFCK